MEQTLSPLPVVYEPGPQLAQAVKGVTEVCPAMHRVQTLLPATAVKDPAAQVEQTLSPLPVLYEPGAQLVQAVKGVTEVCPAMHREQLENPNPVV